MSNVVFSFVLTVLLSPSMYDSFT